MVRAAITVSVARTSAACLSCLLGVSQHVHACVSNCACSNWQERHMTFIEWKCRLELNYCMEAQNGTVV